MTFWLWFQKDGDQLFTFVSLASVALQGVDGLAPGVTKALIIAGVLANVAHRSFFGKTSPGPTAPKAG